MYRASASSQGRIAPTGSPSSSVGGRVLKVDFVPKEEKGATNPGAPVPLCLLPPPYHQTFVLSFVFK